MAKKILPYYKRIRKEIAKKIWEIRYQRIISSEGIIIYFLIDSIW